MRINNALGKLIVSDLDDEEIDTFIKIIRKL